MKNFVKWFGIIAFVAIIGFAFASCELPDELDGTTWTTTIEGDDNYSTTITINFADHGFTMTQTSGGESATQKGDYEMDGSKVTLTLKDGGDKITGTLDGNKLTINGVVFKKK